MSAELTEFIGTAMVIAGSLSCAGGILAALPRKRRPLLLYFLTAPLPWVMPLLVLGRIVRQLTLAIVRRGRPGL